MNSRKLYNEAFVEAFDLEKDSNLEDLKYQSIEEWDSIGHMALMSELEDRFDSIETEDLVQFESYAQGPEILKRYSIEIEQC